MEASAKMIKDGLFISAQVGNTIALVLNASVLITYFLRPLKMNTSKYFIPISSVQNIVYSLCGMLVIPRTSTWNFCWTFVASGVVSDSWALGQCFLQLLFLVLLLTLLTIANNFFHRYLQICRFKYFSFYLSPRGLRVLFAVNAFIIITWTVYLYVGIWPNDELILYLRPHTLERRGVDLGSTAFVGFCVKVRFIKNLCTSRLVPIRRKLHLS
ncbi:unnamed protein product [Heligmosomoides polygyrus]|uniref:G_PROTEIN_RECEP_F1_2 domain-containing protein n=1 Tax=Heligmosomoides polygyrus TaxID=6339 RepID=A0A183FVQ7_HELPZ|nr:unnamed protein product [Heligmosomoides polygyrus]